MAVTDRFQYGPYGELVNHVGTTFTPFEFNGRDGVMTDSNGLYYMRTRYYNPDIRRFVNRDVAQGSIDNGSSLNRFAYVNGGEHRSIPTLTGEYVGTPRDLLAKTIRDLRNYSDAPNTALNELIDLNKATYPNAFRR